MIALDPNKSKLEFVPSCDANESSENQTRFLMRPLTMSELTAIADMTKFTAQGEMNQNTRTKNLLAFRISLDTIKNLRDSEGNEVKLEREATSYGNIVSENFLARIPYEVVQEAGLYIREASSPTAEDAKK